MGDFCCAIGLCNVMLSKARLCWKLSTESRAGSDTQQSPAQCRGGGAPGRAVDAGGNEAGSSSLWVSAIDHCLPGASGTQHHDPQGIFKPKIFHDCPLLPSGLESEGLHNLPTTTSEHQCSLAITCSAS